MRHDPSSRCIAQLTGMRATESAPRCGVHRISPYPAPKHMYTTRNYERNIFVAHETNANPVDRRHVDLKGSWTCITD